MAASGLACGPGSLQAADARFHKFEPGGICSDATAAKSPRARVTAKRASGKRTAAVSLRYNDPLDQGDHRTAERKMREMAGKVAFITGGVSGIGLGLCKAFCSAGMQVIATYMSDDHRDEAQAMLSSEGEAVHFVRLDVTDRQAYARVGDEVERKFGKIHVLCNNAAVGIRGPFAQMEYEDWDWGLSVNIGGVVNGIKTMLPRIKSHGEGGHILAIASMSGVFATPNASVYNASKFAVMGLMETLRGELANDNIGVSVACPGLVRTNLYQTLRLRPVKYRHEHLKSPSAEDVKTSREIMAKGMDALDYGERVLQGIRENRLFIMTHPEFEAGIRDRFNAILDSLPDCEADAARVEVESRYTLRNAIYKG